MCKQILKLNPLMRIIGLLALLLGGGEAQAASYSVANLGMVAQPGDERVYVAPSGQSTVVGSYNGAKIDAAKVAAEVVTLPHIGVVDSSVERVGTGFHISSRNHRVDAGGYTIVATGNAFASTYYYDFNAPVDIYALGNSAAFSNLRVPQPLLPATVTAGTVYQHDYYTLVDTSGQVLHYSVAIDDNGGAGFDLYNNTANPHYDARLAADWANNPTVLQGLVRMVFTISTVANGSVQFTAISTRYFKQGVGEIMYIPLQSTFSDSIRYLVRYSTAGSSGQIGRLVSKTVMVVDNAGNPVLQPWAKAKTYVMPGGSVSGSVDVSSIVFGDPYVVGVAPQPLTLWGFRGQEASWRVSYVLSNFIGHPPSVVFGAKTARQVVSDVATIPGSVTLPKSLIRFVAQDSFANPLADRSIFIIENQVRLEPTSREGMTFAYLSDGHSYTVIELMGVSASFLVHGSAVVTLTLDSRYHYIASGTFGAEIGEVVPDAVNGSTTHAYYFSDPTINPHLAPSTSGSNVVVTMPTTIDSYGVIRLDSANGSGVAHELHRSKNGQFMMGMARAGNPLESLSLVSVPFRKWVVVSDAVGNYFMAVFAPDLSISLSGALDVYADGTAAESLVWTDASGATGVEALMTMAMGVDAYGFLHEVYSAANSAANGNILTSFIPSFDGSVMLVHDNGGLDGLALRKHNNAVSVNNRVFRYWNVTNGSTTMGVTGAATPVSETGLIAFDANGVGISGLSGVQMVQDGYSCGYALPGTTSCTKVGQVKVVVHGNASGGNITVDSSDNHSGTVYTTASTGYISASGDVAIIDWGGEQLLLVDTGEKIAANTGTITGTITDASNGVFGTVQAEFVYINDANWNPVGDGYTIASAGGGFTFSNLPDGVYNIGGVLDTTGTLISGGQNGFDPLRHPVADYTGNPITITNGVVKDGSGATISNAMITVAHLGNNLFGNVTNTYSNAQVVVEHASQGFGQIWDSKIVAAGASTYVIDGVDDSINNYLRACVDVNGNGSCDNGEPVDVYATPVALSAGTQAGGIDFTLTTTSPVVIQGYKIFNGTGTNANSQWMQFNVQDPNLLAASVTVSGGGFTTAAVMSPFNNGKSWGIQDVNVATPASYTITITNKDGTTTTYPVQATGYVTNKATITAPANNSTINGDIAINWTGPLLTGQLYHVQLVDKYGNWHDITPYPGITQTNWAYKAGSAMNDGQVLASGQQVEIRVYIDQATPYGVNNSVASSFINYGGAAVAVPTVSIASPQNNVNITADATGKATVSVTISTTNHPIATGSTHWHLFVDGADQGPQFSTTANVALGVGTHTIKAELRNADHSLLNPTVMVSITVTVNAVVALPATVDGYTYRYVEWSQVDDFIEVGTMQFGTTTIWTAELSYNNGTPDTVTSYPFGGTFSASWDAATGEVIGGSGNRFNFTPDGEFAISHQIDPASPANQLNSAVQVRGNAHYLFLVRMPAAGGAMPSPSGLFNMIGSGFGLVTQGSPPATQLTFHAVFDFYSQNGFSLTSNETGGATTGTQVVNGGGGWTMDAYSALASNGKTRFFPSSNGNYMIYFNPSLNGNGEEIGVMLRRPLQTSAYANTDWRYVELTNPGVSEVGAFAINALGITAGTADRVLDALAGSVCYDAASCNITFGGDTVAADAASSGITITTSSQAVYQGYIAFDGGLMLVELMNGGGFDVMVAKAVQGGSGGSATPAQQQAIISLHGGWNLIGMPVADSNYSFPSDFAALVNRNAQGGPGVVQSIWSYVGGGIPWQNWDANNLGASNLLVLNAGKGYWVKLSPNAAATVTLTGALAVMPTLQTGWNLLSGPQNVVDFAGILGYLQGTGGSAAWSFHGGVWESYITSAPPFLNGMQSMVPERGYYIFK